MSEKLHAVQVKERRMLSAAIPEEKERMIRNENMQAIENEIARLERVKHQDPGTWTKDEKEILARRSTVPSLTCYSPSGKRIWYGIGKDVRERFDPHVAQTTIGDYWVSTVWLSFDHSQNSSTTSTPIIFETMIFCEKEGMENPFSHYQERYSTLEEAKEGHKIAVSVVEEHPEYLQTIDTSPNRV